MRALWDDTFFRENFWVMSNQIPEEPISCYSETPGPLLDLAAMKSTYVLSGETEIISESF